MGDEFYWPYDDDDFLTFESGGGGGYTMPPTDAPSGFDEWLQYMQGAGSSAPGAVDLPDDSFWESLGAAGFEYDPASGDYWFTPTISDGGGTTGLQRSWWDKLKENLKEWTFGSGNGAGSSASGRSASGLSNLASATGQSAAASALGRLAEAQMLTGRDANAINLYRTQLEAPRSFASNAVRGDILANLQDVNLNAPSRIPVTQYSGGLRPSMLSSNTRQLGQNMSQQALASQAAMGTTKTPELSALPEAGFWEQANTGTSNVAGWLQLLMGLFS